MLKWLIKKLFEQYGLLLLFLKELNTLFLPLFKHLYLTTT